MTNQEAIKRIKGHIAIHKYMESHAIHIVEALEMAIKALEEQDVPDTNVGDTISRLAAINAIENLKGMARNRKTVSKESAVYALKELPPVQPELETVKCIIGGGYMDIGDADFSMKCAKCGAEYYHVENYDYDYNFCPNCGRRWRKQDG